MKLVLVLALMLRSAESVAAHFSPQYLNQHSKDNFILVFYEACAGQEIKCDHANLVAFDEKRKKGSA